MFWLGALLLLFAQVSGSLPSPDVPGAPGVYYRQDNARWMTLKPAVVSEADAKGMKLFIDTGGYTDMGMHMVCRGARASARIPKEKPTFFVRGIGPSKDAMLVRLTKKKDSRVFNTSFSNVSVENKGGFDKQDIHKLEVSDDPGGFYSVTPEKELSPGEYLLVIGSITTAYDFGIDKPK